MMSVFLFAFCDMVDVTASISEQFSKQDSKIVVLYVHKEKKTIKPAQANGKQT